MESASFAIQTPLYKEGVFYYEDVAIEPDALEAKIAALDFADRTIILRSDAQTPFEYVVKIIDTCKKYRITSFAIQTADRR